MISPARSRFGLLWVLSATTAVWLLLAILFALYAWLRTVPAYPARDWRTVRIVQATFDSGGPNVCTRPLTAATDPAKLALLHAALAAARVVPKPPRNWVASMPLGGVGLAFANGDSRNVFFAERLLPGRGGVLPNILALSRTSLEGSLPPRFLSSPTLWRLLRQPGFFPSCPLSAS